MTNRELFRIGTGAIILDNKDQVLLGYRGPKARDQHNKWELLGGLVKFGESPSEAIKRVIHEESGIYAEPIEVIGLNDKFNEEKTEQWVGITFICRYLSGKPRATERVLQHKWLPLNECFDQELTPMTQYQLEQYQEWLIRNTTA